MTDPVGRHDRSAARDEAPPGMPRWVKATAIAVLVVAMALVVIALLAGGEHGPGLHTGAGGPSSLAALLAVGGSGTSVA